MSEALPPAGDREAVAIIAGGGTLPLELAQALARRGTASRFIALRGFAGRDVRKQAFAIKDVVDAKGVMAALASLGMRRVVLAGTVRRPSPAVALALLSVRRNQDELRAILKPLADAGDDGLLRGVVSLLEGQGHEVVGIADLAPELLCPAGQVGRHPVAATEKEAIATGQRFLETIAPFDVGQAVIVRKQRILACEGPEGTDATLKRVAGLGGGLFSRKESGGVLIKLPKSNQDLRVDLPAIGPRTIDNVVKAGLTGIVLRAGYTLILERERTIERADAAGLFITGVHAKGDAA